MRRWTDLEAEFDRSRGDQSLATSLLIRWRLTLRLVPSVWANRLTRSSSSIQRASTSTASRSASGGADALRSRALSTTALASAT